MKEYAILYTHKEHGFDMFYCFKNMKMTTTSKQTAIKELDKLKQKDNGKFTYKLLERDVTEWQEIK